MIRTRREPHDFDVVFSGGGTAGHIEPALALARALVAAGHQPERLHFVGSRQGMEARRVPDAGFSITLLPGRGIVRRLAWRNLAALGGLAVAFGRALSLLLRHRPGVVVTFGGYAGLPAALAAPLAGVPLVVVNLDAVPGASNRLVGHFATRCALAFPTEGLRRGVVTGAPLRESVLAAPASEEERRAARSRLGLPEDRLLIVVVGGSLGAGRLNAAALGLGQLFAPRSDLVLWHIAGARNLEQARAELAALDLGADGIDYRLVDFSTELPALFALASLVISRAGAMTVAELAAIGTPSILVPLPNAPADHQRKNAAALGAAGGAIVVADEQATPEHLATLLRPLLADPAHLEQMAAAARSVGRRDATREIVLLLEALGASEAAKV